MRTILLLFFSAIGLITLGQDFWVQIDSMNGPPKSVTTSFVLLNHGFVVGGLTDIDFTRKMYSYNPLQDDWDNELSWGGETGGGQNRGSAISFTAYNKAYVGLGQGNSAGFYNDLWEYDPSTETWTQKADFIGSARRSAVAFSINDIGYVGTGQDASGLTNDFYSYEALSNSWIQLNDFVGTARRSATAFAMGGEGYLGAGDDGIMRNDFWQYQPVTDTWIQRASIPGTGRAGAVGWGNFPTAFICAGEDPMGNFKKDLWEYNFYGNSWVQRSDLPGPPRKHATAFFLNGFAYVGTGFNGQFLDDFYRYEQLLGNQNLHTLSVEIYPNPTSEWLYLKTPLSVAQLTLIDLTGKTILTVPESEFIQPTIAISLHTISSGTYYLTGFTAEGNSFHTMFIKE